MTKDLPNHINFNTILITILLALSGWTLKSITELREQSVLLAYRLDRLEGEHKKTVSTEYHQELGSATSLALGQLGSFSPSK